MTVREKYIHFVVLFTCVKLNKNTRTWVLPISSPCMSCHISLSSHPETVASLSSCLKLAFIFCHRWSTSTVLVLCCITFVLHLRLLNENKGNTAYLQIVYDLQLSGALHKHPRTHAVLRHSCLSDNKMTLQSRFSESYFLTFLNIFSCFTPSFSHLFCRSEAFTHFCLLPLSAVNFLIKRIFSPLVPWTKQLILATFFTAITII